MTNEKQIERIRQYMADVEAATADLCSPELRRRVVAGENCEDNCNEKLHRHLMAAEVARRKCEDRIAELQG